MKWDGWIGPLGFSRRWTAGWLAGFRALADGLAGWPRWLGLALALGAIPVLVDYASGARVCHAMTALLGWPLLLAAAARDRVHPCLTCLILAFVVHALTVIVLAAIDPTRMALAFPAGWEYWEETEHWIRTGESVKYDVGWWVPVHVQIAGVMFAWCYLSLGLVPLLQGVYEIDLMNFYVGRLLARAESPGAGLLFAWHPWSLCRGVGFLFLMFDIASFSLARLTGEPLSPLSTRRRRWLLGVGFLLLDALIKGTSSEAVRRTLAAQLTAGGQP